jgi:hypothetical protein
VTKEEHAENMALTHCLRITRAIKVLSEGHMAIMSKLDENLALEYGVESLEHRMSATEHMLKR